MKKKDLIKKWLDNEQLSAKELEAFNDLDAYDSYIKISETAKKIVPPKYDVEHGLQDLNKKLLHHKKIKTPVSSLSILIRIAAIFILGIGTFFTFFNNDTVSISTLASQKTTIELPDLSIVKLNSLSEINYEETDWENNRKIKLDGEAFFDVAKGEKFDVITSSGLISVLGTEFNVNQRENYFEVTCYEGLVRVTYNDNVIDLPAGKTYKVIHNKITNEDTVLLKPNWTENQSTFSSTPFIYILREFERQYGVTIIAKNIDQDKLFTGNFVHSNIQTALQSITISMRLKYEINGNNVTLYKE